jgi:hypothetical protein
MRSLKGQQGQAAVGLVLMVSFVLLGGAGFAVDAGNAWMHRQSAQAAADAACQAANMDMYALASGATLPYTGFVEGVAGSCSSFPSATMCQYAAMNGYSGSGNNVVSWTWPSTVAGAKAAPSAVTTYPYLQVNITESVPTHFMSSVGGPAAQTVAVTSTCGLVQSRGTSPVAILNPILPAAFTMALGGNLTIVGGPQRGLQVNSSDPLAVTGVAGATVNTSAGGTGDNGSSVGVVGGPSSSGGLLGTGFSGGTNGKWSTGVSPMPDPFAAVSAPSSVVNTPTSSVLGKSVSYHQDGCPDSTYGCVEFSPGSYPLGINLQTILAGKRTAIFLPGVYSLGGPLLTTPVAGNILRNATPCSPTCSSLSTTTGSRTDGVMFYFGAVGSLSMVGSPDTTGVDAVSSSSLTCDGSTPDSALGIPSTVNGTVLWAQCTANGTYWDSGGDTTDSAGTTLAPGGRGLLAFAGHANVLPPTFAATNGMVFSGALYFHNALYLDIVPFAASSLPLGLVQGSHSVHANSQNRANLLGLGGSPTGIYILGPIVADQLTIAAGTQVNVDLGSGATQNLVKVAMVQ